MIKNLTKYHLDQYSEMLGFKFKDGRSATTAQLHSVLKVVLSAFAGSTVWDNIEKRPLLESINDVRTQGKHPPHSGSRATQDGSSSRAGWQCLSEQHWSCDSFGARVDRSPHTAGISWGEVERGVTRRLPDLEVLEDI